MFYAIQNNDGTVAIMNCVDGHDPEEEILKWSPEAIAKVVSFREITEDNVPSDRTFRDAWTDDNPGEHIDIDLDRAKEIKRNHFRKLRKPLFDVYDVQSMRAIEAGDQTTLAAVIAKKTELRDVTTLPLPDDIEELKNFIPDCLHGVQ